MSNDKMKEFAAPPPYSGDMQQLQPSAPPPSAATVSGDGALIAHLREENERLRRQLNDFEHLQVADVKRGRGVGQCSLAST